MDILKSKKIPKDNTTGVKGVYKVRGKYLVKIVFQKKQYILGQYNDLATAAEVRRKAEQLLFDEVVDFYDQWNHWAEKDPDWAKNNPIRISVDKNGSDLNVHFLPVLPKEEKIVDHVVMA